MRILWYVMTALAVFVAFYGFAFLLVPGVGSQVIRDRFLAVPLVGLSHVFGGGIALVLGPFQLSDRLRARNVEVHRWLGRLYLMAVLASGLAGLYSATVTFGGLPANLGFGLLAVLWLGSGAMALLRIRQGDRARHRRWMVRNYALTYAAVTLRIALPLMLASGVPLESAYQTIAWLCWVPNLLLVEWVLLRR